MYKVLIVDDEVLVRVGIKSTIDWENYGFTVVAEASNGEQAYDAYMQHKPDVVLTDIRMPKKDGLWLTKTIRKENLQAKIIILTCYNDFDYAREALKSGADDYILKSEAEDEELIKAFSNVKEALDSELNEQERSDYLKKQMDTNIAAVKEKLLDGFLKSDNAVDDRLLARCADFGFDPEGAGFVLAVMFRDDAQRRAEVPEQEWQHMNNAIANIASGILDEAKISYLAKENNNEFIFLLSKRDLKTAEVHDAVEAIRSAVTQYFDIPLSAAVSSRFDDIAAVSGTYHHLCQSAGQLFYMNESSVVDTSGKFPQNINIFSIKKSFEQLLINCMDEEDEEKAVDVIAQTEDFFRRNNAKVTEVKLFYSNMVSSIFERYHHCIEEDWNYGDYTYNHDRIMAITKIRSIVRLVEDVILTVIRNIKNYRLSNSNNIIRKAIDYIEKNYHTEISLKLLSEYLNLSKHYVCYLFKKETGDNISLYVNKLRIEKAKQLILDSDCKIKEIYDKVGFSDLQYFCKTFKKMTGMTVVSYRDSILKKERHGA